MNESIKKIKDAAEFAGSLSKALYIDFPQMALAMLLSPITKPYDKKKAREEYERAKSFEGTVLTSGQVPPVPGYYGYLGHVDPSAMGPGCRPLEREKIVYASESPLGKLLSCDHSAAYMLLEAEEPIMHAYFFGK